ncbi:hypothetical protein OG462_27585 [Streptomyces sp. NBC_01077]|uniref:hypothetical protein n=1 Tax=Streptomyces sp. NBC_01077 TaxID=2903746 RepID=UPI003862E6AF|nr:hypothetical protein OG462_27585 [Streptomyces sp. NBC_01077]
MWVTLAKIRPVVRIAGLDVAGVNGSYAGLVVVLLGVLVMNEMPTAPGAALTALGIAACCVWAGLRRTGWSLRPLITRLGRV